MHGVPLVRVGTRRSSRENPARRWHSVFRPSPSARVCPRGRESRSVSVSRFPWGCNSTQWLGPILAILEPLMQFADVSRSVFFVLLVGDAVHPGTGILS